MTAHRGTQNGQPWKLASCLVTLEQQVDLLWPDRRKQSDGTIGDAAHASRKSDHNPDDNGYVCALDITTDHLEGPDETDFADRLASTNPNFDRARFLKACGVEEGK